MSGFGSYALSFYRVRNPGEYCRIQGQSAVIEPKASISRNLHFCRTERFPK